MNRLIRLIVIHYDVWMNWLDLKQYIIMYEWIDYIYCNTLRCMNELIRFIAIHYNVWMNWLDLLQYIIMYEWID